MNNQGEYEATGKPNPPFKINAQINGQSGVVCGPFSAARLPRQDCGGLRAVPC